jgi:hypothetical protein
MVKITTEVNGKKYELVPRGACANCDLHGIKTTICQIHPTDNSFNGQIVCAVLHGIWKEVRDAD